MRPGQPLYPKVDGFSYNTSSLLVPNRFFPLALGQLEILRRARNYRARWWTVPADDQQTIAAFDTIEYQVNVANGTYLYGVMFTALSRAGAVTDFLISVVDSCTGVPLSNDFAGAQFVSSNGNSNNFPVLLTQPRLILDPGLVAVEISNRTALESACQLLLMFAEPCKVIEEASRAA